VWLCYIDIVTVLCPGVNVLCVGQLSVNGWMDASGWEFSKFCVLQLVNNIS
jgi:hypothetical protein